MKTLLILRHAKAAHDPLVSDFDRPLTKHGERDADAVGRWLKKQGLVPDAIVSSSAVRAKTTAERVAEACGYEGSIELKPELYLAETEGLIHALRELPDKLDIVMVVGHNPGLQHLLRAVTGKEGSLSTAALARVEFPIHHWSRLDAQGVLKELRQPV